MKEPAGRKSAIQTTKGQMKAEKSKKPDVTAIKGFQAH